MLLVLLLPNTIILSKKVIWLKVFLKALTTVTMRRQTTQFAGGYNVHARLCVCDDKSLSVHTRVDLVSDIGDHFRITDFFIIYLSITYNVETNLTHYMYFDLYKPTYYGYNLH